jgi:hypothetical protein
MTRKIWSSVVLCAAMAGCTTTIYSNHEDLIVGTPAPATFDVSAVQAHFAAACEAQVVVDRHFCRRTRIEDMRGEGDTLYVPTTLTYRGGDRAVAICDQLAVAHVDEDGRDLGYRTIDVRYRAGGHLADCRIRGQ